MKHRLEWFSVSAIVAGLVLGSCGDGAHEATLTLRYWQAPSTLNPYLSGGVYKDLDAAALVLEPLANYDEHGRLTPRRQQMGRQ